MMVTVGSGVVRFLKIAAIVFGAIAAFFGAISKFNEWRVSRSEEATPHLGVSTSKIETSPALFTDRVFTNSGGLYVTGNILNATYSEIRIENISADAIGANGQKFSEYEGQVDGSKIMPLAATRNFIVRLSEDPMPCLIRFRVKFSNELKLEEYVAIQRFGQRLSLSKVPSMVITVAGSAANECK